PVMRHCASVKRKRQEDTWITQELIMASNALHQEGIAKYAEVWYASKVEGGLYGVDLGRGFCGARMCSLMSNASKVAFSSLARTLEKKQYRLIDCQLHTDHLSSMGAVEIPREDFIRILKQP